MVRMVRLELTVILAPKASAMAARRHPDKKMVSCKRRVLLLFFFGREVPLTHLGEQDIENGGSSRTRTDNQFNGFGALQEHCCTN